MIYRILADAIVVLHLAFILFVVLGGFLVLHRTWVAWLHVPVVLWGGGIELAGKPCPLTGFENRLRALGAEEGYAGSFIEQYLMPLIYPEILFPGGVPRAVFIALGVAVLAFNAVIYWRLWRRRRG